MATGITAPATAPVTQTVGADWITPEQQLLRLCRLPQRTTDLCAHLGLTHFSSKIPFEHMKDDLDSNHPNLTYWYTALGRLGMLPDKIPPLPENIRKILDSECPISQGQISAGKIETHNKVIDTHLLYLLPAGSVHDFVSTAKAYGETHLEENKGENPLQFSFVWDKAYEEHAHTPFDQPKWVLMSKDVLPGSCNQRFETQAQMIQDLKGKWIHYQVPSLREVVGATFLYNVATKSRILKSFELGHFEHTCTRIRETTQEQLLDVGCFSSRGLLFRDSLSYMGSTGSGIVGLVNLDGPEEESQINSH